MSIDPRDQISSHMAEYRAVKAELALVKAQLLQALCERDTAKAQLSSYQRKGW
jgi:hypothetical protein